ncbi:MAG: hypothetical protein U1F25_00050 [Rubrivivax sp.]
MLPQNVQLALEARYAAQFMRAHEIEFARWSPTRMAIRAAATTPHSRQSCGWPVTSR